MRISLAFAAIVLVLSMHSQTFAQPVEKPVIARIKGQPVTATWTNGNIAELRFNRGSNISSDVPFKVSENLCAATGTGQQFTAHFQVRVDKLGWFWRTHSDAAKLNKPLTFRSPAANPLISFAFVTNSYRQNFPDLVFDLPLDQFTFGDLSWLPGMEGGLKAFTVESWTSEAMLPNSETGISENRISGELTGVRFSLVGPNTAEISQVDSVVGLTQSGGSFALLGDVVGWNWRLPNGEMCPIAFKPNLVGLNQAVTIAVGNPLNDTYTTYIFGQDSLEQAVLQFINDENVSFAE